MKISLIEQIESVSTSSRLGLHIDEITEKLREQYTFKDESFEHLSKRVGSILSSNVKKKGGLFSRVNGRKKGTYKRGRYRLKSTASKKVIFNEAPKVTTQYTGCAGEHAVLSELLFWGFNASMMTVDDGIDIVASKNTDFFYIQVKTSNVSRSNSYNFKVDTKRFSEKSNYRTFYTLVLRRMDSSGKYYNDYVVLPNYEIKSMMTKGIITSTQTISMNVTVNKNKFSLNGVDVTTWVNNFDVIE